MISFVLSFLFWGAIGFTQQQPVTENPLSVQAVLEPPQLPAGANGTVKIYLNLLDGHHAYVDQFRLTTEDSNLFRVGHFEITPILDFDDPFTKKRKKVVEGHALMMAPLEISPDAKGPTMKINLELTYQACTKDYCLFPKVLKVPLTFEVVPGALGTPQGKAWNQTLDELFHKSLENNIALAFVIVFLGGILTSLTPCIFPMIPITLAVLGARGTKVPRRRRFLLSLLYVLGIALTYSVLGLVVAWTGAIFGAFLGNRWVVFALATVFVVMGFSMLGWFEIALPAQLQTSLSRKKTGEGFFGALVSGLLAGLIASPCVGPVLVSILTYVAQTQNAVLGFSLLFVFALGMGQIFLILGASTELLDRLPRSGPWLDGTKKIFAVSFFALALWYVKPVLPQGLFLLVAAAFICFSSWALGLFKRGMPKGGATILYRTALMGVFFFGIYVGARGFQLFLSEKSGAPIEKQNTLRWQKYSDALLSAAQKQHRPVLIDFWADWCVACKELEVTTFNDPNVRTMSEQFVLLKYDATVPSADFEALKKRYGIVGLPNLIFYDSHGNYRPDLTLTGFERGSLFINRMQKAF